VGALVHLIWSVGDAPVGSKPPVSFVALFLGDLGVDPEDVLNRYLRTPKALPSGPQNSQPKWNFFWYTLDNPGI
jgi:hypothetical protein